MGGKTLSFYVTMGPYDYVAIGEGPSDEAAAALAWDSPPGRVSTLSMKPSRATKIAAMSPNCRRPSRVRPATATSPPPAALPHDRRGGGACSSRAVQLRGRPAGR